jgi:hypothetical protein
MTQQDSFAGESLAPQEWVDRLMAYPLGHCWQDVSRGNNAAPSWQLTDRSTDAALVEIFYYSAGNPDRFSSRVGPFVSILVRDEDAIASAWESDPELLITALKQASLSADEPRLAIVAALRSVGAERVPVDEG